MLIPRLCVLCGYLQFAFKMSTIGESRLFELWMTPWSMLCQTFSRRCHKMHRSHFKLLRQHSKI